MASKPKNFQDYLNNAPQKTQAKLKLIREIILKNVPTASEIIEKNIPVYQCEGKKVCVKAKAKSVSISPVDKKFIKENNKELNQLKFTSTEELDFPINQQLPLSLIKKYLKSHMPKQKNIKKAKIIDIAPEEITQKQEKIKVTPKKVSLKKNLSPKKAVSKKTSLSQKKKSTKTKPQKSKSVDSKTITKKTSLSKKSISKTLSKNKTKAKKTTSKIKTPTKKILSSKKVTSKKSKPQKTVAKTISFKKVGTTKKNTKKVVVKKSPIKIPPKKTPKIAVKKVSQEVSQKNSQPNSDTKSNSLSGVVKKIKNIFTKSKKK